MEKKNSEITVGFVSLGCPKNVVDSERMLAEIAQAGFPITTEPDNADVVVINTCGFIAPARIESLDAIRSAVDCKRLGTVKKIIVAGCLGQRMGQKIFDQVDGIDTVVSLAQRDNVAKIIEKIFSSEKYPAFPTSDHHPLSPSRDDVPDDRCRLLITPSHWA